MRVVLTREEVEHARVFYDRHRHDASFSSLEAFLMRYANPREARFRAEWLASYDQARAAATCARQSPLVSAIGALRA